MGEAPARIVISAALVETMRAHVLACLPEEACGLLGGEIGGADVVARIVIPVENALHSPVRFRMDPVKQLEAFNLLDSLGLELAGIFHSHPTGPDSPSPTDLAEFYYPGTPLLIWSPLGADWRLRAFLISEEHPGADKTVFSIPILTRNP